MHYVHEALAALGSNDPIAAVAARITCLACNADTVPGDLFLFRFHFVHRAIDLFVQEPWARDRITHVFKALTEQPEQRWLAFMSAYVIPFSSFETFVHATARFEYNGEDLI